MQPNLVQQPTQQLGPAGLQTSAQGDLSHHQSSEALSHQVSALLPQDSDGPLKQHGSAQLPMAPSTAHAPQLPSGQLSQHASEQLGHRPSDSSGQSPSIQMSEHMAAHQGSSHMGCDSRITRGPQGSQSAGELPATDQQAADRAETPADRAEAPVEMTQPAATNQAMLDGWPNQAAGSTSGAGTAYQQTPVPQLHASHFQMQSGEGSYNPRTGHGLHQQQPQQLSGMQMPPQSSAVGTQHHAGAAYDPSGASSDGINASSGGVHGSEGRLASPNIGLKLGEAHSPGLSEDALGCDQEFMDAMQAMAGQLRHLHACCCFCTCLEAGLLTVSEEVHVVLCRQGALRAVGRDAPVVSKTKVWRCHHTSSTQVSCIRQMNPFPMLD